MDERELLGAKLNRRRLLRYGLLAGGSWAGLGLLSACAPSNSTLTTASATPRRGGTLIFGQGTGPANLDPHEYLSALRSFLGRRNGSAVMLGEVNLPYKEQLDARR